MTLAKELQQKIANPALTHNERALLRCRFAKELEEVGNFEGAREAMGELWSRVGERPVLDELDRMTAAEVLLRVGVLTGWIGSAKQIGGAQETAKNLITESIAIFDSSRNTKKAAEAQIDLAICYWREGAYDEARIMLKEASERLTDEDKELKAVALLRRAIIERVALRLHDALQIHTQAAPLFETSGSDVLKGKFHNEYGTVLKNLGAAEGREDYIDQAFVEYAAACFHFEQAGHTRYRACVENNLGMLFLIVRKFPEAHEHLDRAQALFTTLKDSVHTAQVDDTRARVMLAEGRNPEAERLVRSAVQTLEKGGEQALLAEALTTHGVALARLGRHQPARLTLRRAIEVARQAGDMESAGRAALTLIEELGDRLPDQDLIASYSCAVELVADSKSLNTLARLGVCARRVLFLTERLSAPSNWTGFSFRRAVHRYEARLIEKALSDAGGMVTRAARLLGFKHHHSLVAMLNERHRDLLPARNPAVPRRRSIMTARRTTPDAPDRQPQAVRILHVEDHRVVADAVKETLEAQGWRVESCADGTAALRKITGSVRYDLLILDNELPGVSGLNLARRARQLPHRRRTPVVVLSAADCEREAWGAGADAFLRKPEDVGAVVDTVKRLLRTKTE